MQFIGLFITYLLGISIYLNFTEKKHFVAALGYGFLLGIGTQTFSMLIMNLIGIQFNITNIFVLSILITILFLGALFKKNGTPTFSKNSILKFLDFENYKHLNLVWLVAVGAIIYLVYSITQKNIFWPTNTSDSLSSFDVFAKALAHEGQIFNSLIYEKRVGYGAAYPPLYSLGLSYAYQVGFETSKIIPALFFISLPMCLYSGLKRISTNTLAICITLIAIATPELIAQSAVNITNVPQAIYGSLAVLNMMIFLKTKDVKALYLAAITAAFNGFIRSEGIIYIGLLIFILGIAVLQKKHSLKQLIIFSVIALFPFVLWQLTLKLNSEVMEKFVQVTLRKTPYMNWEQINHIFDLGWLTISSTQMYGITIYAVLISFILNIKNIYKSKDNIGMLFIVLFSVIGYLILINQMILKSDTFLNIIRFSGKRYFLGPILLAWIYVGTNKMSVDIFKPVEKWLSFDSKK